VAALEIEDAQTSVSQAYRPFPPLPISVRSAVPNLFNHFGQRIQGRRFAGAEYPANATHFLTSSKNDLYTKAMGVSQLGIS
jgi:hypothetical protein